MTSSYVTFFDWDDTLLSSYALTKAGLKLNSGKPTGENAKSLKLLDTSAEKLITHVNI